MADSFSKSGPNDCSTVTTNSKPNIVYAIYNQVQSKMPSYNTQSAKYKTDGELRKGHKGKDFCFFCDTAVLNFARHIQRNHSAEPEVQKIGSLPKNIKEKKNCYQSYEKREIFLLVMIIQKQ